MQKITPFLWYNGTVAEAVAHYRAIFPAMQVHASSPGPNGKLMTATVEIEGQQLILFDGGPHEHVFNTSFSLFINCETQAEVDRLWAQLSEGGHEDRCGWVQDRFGLSWQVIPTILPKLLGDPDRAKATRAMQAMFTMRKIDIAALEAAAAGA